MVMVSVESSGRGELNSPVVLETTSSLASILRAEVPSELELVLGAAPLVGVREVAVEGVEEGAEEASASVLLAEVEEEDEAAATAARLGRAAEDKQGWFCCCWCWSWDDCVLNGTERFLGLARDAGQRVDGKERAVSMVVPWGNRIPGGGGGIRGNRKRPHFLRE